MRVLSLIGLIPAFACIAAAQGMVESAILTSGAAAAAAKTSKTVNSAITSTIGSMSKTVEAKPAGAGASNKAPAKAGVRSSTVALNAAPRAPEIQPATPARAELESVQEGTPRSELLAKVGHPSFAVSTPQEGHLIEVLSYSTKDAGPAKVKLKDGKVASIEWPQAKP